MGKVSFRFDSAKELVFFIALLLVCSLLAIATGLYGVKAGGVIVVALTGFLVVLYIFYKYSFGFFVLLLYSHFMFLIDNLVKLPFPVGTPVDIILLLTLLSYTIHKQFRTTPVLVKEYPFKSAIGIFIVVSVVLDLVQVLNPLSHLPFDVTLLQLRESLYLISIFFIAYKILSTYQAIVRFSVLWVSLSLLAALYGLFQEYAGLRDFEWEFLRSDPRRFELYFIWGRVRKWSFFADPSVFGMQMAFCGIFCFIIALGKFRPKIRITALLVAVISLMSMSYSGTRTAVAMVPLGVALYFFMTLNNPKMLAAAIFTALVFIAIIVGPFYGSTANRIRSTFNKDDPSMSLRDGKRKVLQGYLLQHPLGSGLGTANGIAGRYTVTRDTDNGYLRTAIDKGILGLVLQLSLYASVMLLGIQAYYRSQNSKIKSLYAAYLAGFFALSFAAFYQDVADQKPLNFLLIALFSIMLRLEKTHDQTELT